MTTNDDHRQRRREQVRLAQRRRRARLSEGNRIQINLFLTQEASDRMDALALLWGVERQEVLERLLTAVRIDVALPPINTSID